MQEPQDVEPFGRPDRLSDPVVGIEQEVEGHPVIDELLRLAGLARGHAHHVGADLADQLVLLSQLREEVETGQSTVVAEGLEDHGSAGVRRQPLGRPVGPGQLDLGERNHARIIAHGAKSARLSTMA